MAGALLIGVAMMVFSVIDRVRARVLTHMFKRDVIIRIGTVLAIILIVLVITVVNDSVADARKIEYIGPYIAQEIGVNRYLGELGHIKGEHTRCPDISGVAQQHTGVCGREQ